MLIYRISVGRPGSRHPLGLPRARWLRRKDHLERFCVVIELRLTPRYGTERRLVERDSLGLALSTPLYGSARMLERSLLKSQGLIKDWVNDRGSCYQG